MCTQLCPTLWPQGLWPTGLLCPWDFSRQEYWSGLLLPTPEDLPDSRIESAPLASPALADRFFTTSASWEAQIYTYIYIYILGPHCGMQDPSSPTREWTHSPCSGSMDSQPLDFQGSPWLLWYWKPLSRSRGFLLFFCCAIRHVRSYFPHQGSTCTPPCMGSTKS